MHDPADTLESLREENQRLRARVQELEKALVGRTPHLTDPTEPGAPEHQIPYQAIFEKLPVPLIVYRADGLVLDANERHLSFVGASRDEVIGRHDLLTAHCTQERDHVASFARAASGELVKLPPAAQQAEEVEPDRRVWSETTYFSIQGHGGSRYVVELNLDVTEQQRAEDAARVSSTLLSSIVDNSTLLIYAKDFQGRYVLLNQPTARLIGRTWDQVKGKTDYDIFPKDVADSYGQDDRKVMVSQETIEREDVIPTPNGAPRYFVTAKFPLRDSDGRFYAVASISTDITAHKLAEAENCRLQDEIIRVQEDTLRALSTPLMPIAKGVVVMPLIGTLDRARAEHVLDALLTGVATYQATNVIVDITGVPGVDAQVASALIRAAQALKLIGAQVVLTGIQPKIAQTLVMLGTNLEGVVTKGTLESGIAYVLRSCRW